jgi:hypothetical protein
MAKLPYGISNFETLVNRGNIYIDRTPYLEKLENLSDSYLFFLRPRRFGKSLWVSVMQYYYGLEHKDKFQKLFGQYHIGQHPTPLANSYLVLKFDFSGINTDSQEQTYKGFSAKVKDGIKQFLDTYSKYFSEDDSKDILSETAPEIVLNRLFTAARKEGIPHVYVVIDEYDHFTNELFSFRLTEFREIVSENGFVRKFYEVIKTGTQEGVVDRFFATGVAPVTLDSLTSGFNISSNISLKPLFNEMMGFVETEVEGVLKEIGVAPTEIPETMDEVRSWYNGYLFHPRAKRRVYNSDMVLFFAKEYQQAGGFPDSLLDTNISSDFGKIGKVFRLGGEESKRWELLQDLLSGREVSVQLTEQFSFARSFTEHDFLSLLFYMGLVTIQGAKLSALTLQIPNEVIRKLYYQYFLEKIQQMGGLKDHAPDVLDNTLEFAQHNNPRPLVSLLEKTLAQLSNRDWPGFGEKHLKSILIAYFYSVGIYHIQSEPEIGQGYADLLLRRRPPFEPPYQFMIELKFFVQKGRRPSRSRGRTRSRAASGLPTGRGGPQTGQPARLALGLCRD